MGYLGGKTTTTVETGEMSDRGMEYDKLFTDMLLATLDEAGWDMAPKEVTEFRDPSKATNLETRISDLNSQIADIDAQIAARPSRQYQAGRNDPLTQQKINLQNQLFGAQNEYNRLEKTTYTDYNITKRPDPRVQDAIDKYGEGAPEVRAVQDQIKADEATKAESLAGIERDTIQNLKKYVNGDMSFTPQQEAQVDNLFGRVKDVIISTTDDLLKKVGADDSLLREELGKIGREIDKTGYDVLSALEGAKLQIEETGQGLLDTLQKVNKSTRDRFKFEQDLLFQQIDTQAAQQAAFMGLPPGSMAEITQKAKMKNDTLRSLELDLYQREAEGELGIRGQIGEQKRQISLAKVALAESQGQKKEGLAGSFFDLASRRSSREQDIMGARGNALLAFEQMKASQLQNLAFGNLPSMFGAGQSGLGFEQAFKSGEFGLATQQMAPILTQLGVEQQRQFAETTTTQKKSGGFLDILNSIANTAAAFASPFVGKKSGGGDVNQASMSFPSVSGPAIPQMNLGTSSYPTAQPTGPYLNWR